MTERIGMSAGGGGSEQRRLIELIRGYLGNPVLDPLEDAALLNVQAAPGEALAFTTDSYVVHPWRFPGGDIGSLAVCGTVNDLVVMGARPLWLSLGLIIEEGFPLSDLELILASIKSRAAEAGVAVATGDTKLVEHGKGDAVYINTAGIGLRPAGRDYGAHRIEPGQVLLVSGALGDHAVAVMCSREGMEFEVDVQSDCAPLGGLVEALVEAAGPGGIFAMRDLTRGGLAAVLNEYAAASGCDMLVEETHLPVHGPVRMAAKVLGIEPAALANEGKLLAVVGADAAEAALVAMRAQPYGREAGLIGETGPRFDELAPSHDRPRRPLVLFHTASGGMRLVEMPLGELLPRIC